MPFYEFFNKVEIPAQGCPETPGEGPSGDEIPSRGGASSLAYVPWVRPILTLPRGLEPCKIILREVSVGIETDSAA